MFGLPIRWYALAYIAGFIIGYYILKYLTGKDDAQIRFSNKDYDDIVSYVVLGVILGGRLGYVLFYDLHYFIMHPWMILALWKGGMSFHGGLIGVILSTFIFASTHKFADKSKIRNAFRILDILAVCAPIGLGLGRIANFINMEVMGRPTDSPLGVIFNGVPGFENARHPSPLYESALEGFVLFIIMWLLYTKTSLKKYPGAIGGMLCICLIILISGEMMLMGIQNRGNVFVTGRLGIACGI